jgi:cellulose synthase/poly-beta-1,6-N-acetylglucosamine synthase-like glycosyltransferase
LRDMIDLGGWNEHALVEDAELGLRLFLEKQIKPGWLSCYEIEQTPPDYKVYLKQRQRWALGHFQLLPLIRKTKLPFGTKFTLYWKVLSAILKSPIDIGLPVLAWLALFLGWTQGVPQWLGWIMVTLFVSSVFVWDFFGRGYRMLKKYLPAEYENWDHSRIHQLYFIVAMPWLILMQAQPRLLALYQYLTGSGPDVWVKTRRSVEEPSGETPRLIRVGANMAMPKIDEEKIIQRVEP